MTSVIHLVRHGHLAQLGKTLCGRMTGVQLDALGCEQMELCAAMIKPAPIAIQSSPQPRAMQSADFIARRYRLAVEVVPALDELDYGEWTGKTFAELERDPRWVAWNTRRARSRPPGGESMRALQKRVVDHLEQLRADGHSGAIAIVSHAEPIRAALLHYSGIGLDDFLAVDVDPASISTLIAGPSGLQIAEINQQVPA
jgi:probable phosphoglycerate mutase